MLYNLQIQKILVKVDTVKSPYDKVKLIKEAIKIADANNDIEWGFDLRKQIIEEEKNTSSCIEGLPAFTWILDTYDQNPDICAESSFLQEYKWMIQAARRNANVSLEQFESIVDDYRTRLLRNNFSLHSYYSAKAHMAFQQLKLEEAKEYLELRKEEKRDDLSFCVACEMHDLVEYELLAENVEDAITIATDILSGKEACRYVPFQTVCITVNVLNRHGYDDSAVKLLQIANYTLEKPENDDMSNIGYIGNLIYFLTGVDKEKAWEMFEKYLSWSINCEDYYNFQFSSGSLSLFKGSGTRSLNVNSEIPWYKPSGVYELPELYDYYKDQAATLAAKFDERNGCTNFTELLSRMD
jgi:hypothetical protein